MIHHRCLHFYHLRKLHSKFAFHFEDRGELSQPQTTTEEGLQSKVTRKKRYQQSISGNMIIIYMMHTNGFPLNKVVMLAKYSVATYFDT
jgi:hypothetical protein